jgi:anti-anti-sigma regulatory factor
MRVGGKGSFAKTPGLKSYAERRMRDGQNRFVIDLDECTMMDSTFMGTLAGLAMKLAKTTGGCLQVAGASERNRQSLEDLGLDALIDLDPRDAAWQGHLEEIRGELEPLEEEATSPDAALILKAHQELCDANSSNLAKFATVLDVLEQQVDER